MRLDMLEVMLDGVDADELCWQLAAGCLDGVAFCRPVDDAHVVTVERRLPCHPVVAGKVDQTFPSFCHRPLLLSA